MGDLYYDGILEWSERQARLLRDVAAGRPGKEAPDWANVIEEIESVGRSQLSAVKSLLVQALLHDLKSAGWPQPQTRSVSAMSRDVPHWRAEARGFRDEAADAYAPSMSGEPLGSTRQHIDVADLYRKALRRLPESLAETRSVCGWDGQPPLPVPDVCPVTLDELLAP